jgi:hypothetical protein
VLTQSTVLGSDSTCVALADTGRPAGKSVGDIAAVTVGCDSESQVTTLVEGAGVVHARGLVEFLDTISLGSLQELLETIAGRGACDAIFDHLVDLAFGTWVLHVRAVVAGT